MDSPGKPNSLVVRKHPSHGVFSNSIGPTIVFVTVCTENRIPWLANEAVHQILQKVWADSSSWMVGDYVLMPEHLHFFTAQAQADIPFENWMKYWKSQFARLHKDPKHRWQTGQWDTRLRSNESYKEKWDYVRANPVRRGLVEESDEWPFQGQIHCIYW